MGNPDMAWSRSKYLEGRPRQTEIRVTHGSALNWRFEVCQVQSVPIELVD